MSACRWRFFSAASGSASPASISRRTRSATLNAGGSYIVRILPDAIQAAQQAGFRATSDYSRIAEMDAVIICVPTPLNEHHEPDLSYVTGTVKSIAPYIHEGQLIVLESTTYPGTTEEIVSPAARSRQSQRPQGCMSVERMPRPIRTRRLFARARRPGERYGRPPRHSQGHRRLRPDGHRAGFGPLRQPSSAA
jgi:hypothetical protein